MKLERTLCFDAVNDFGRKRATWTVGTEVVKGFEIVGELCNAAVVNVFQSLGGVYTVLIGSYHRK